MKPPDLTDRQRATLLALGRYHFLTAEQITRLCWGHSLRYVQATVLPDLISQRLVDKKDYNKLFRRKGQRGKEYYYYALSLRGRRWCREQGQDVPLRYKPTETPQPLHMHHTIAVNDFLITTVLLTRHEPQIQLRSLVHERDFKRDPIRLPDGTTYAPDALFELLIADQPYGYLLEMDLGTEDQRQWKDKLHRLLLYLDGQYLAEMQTETLPQVCIVSPGSAQRLKNLQLWTRQMTEWRDIFFFTAADPASEPQELFFQPVWYELHQTSPGSLIVVNEGTA